MGSKASDASHAERTNPGFFRRRKWYFLGIAVLVSAAVGVGAWLIVGTGNAQEAKEPPEASRILALQTKAPFQIIIPGYLPKEFDRENMTLDFTQPGPAGEPMVEMTYSTPEGQAVHIKEWVPQNPDKEILAQSHPIQTKWGPGFLLTQQNLLAIWVDVGPTRVSMYTGDPSISREMLLGMAESLGPPSNNQVFTFIVEKPVIKDMPPAPPFVAPVDAKGVQQVTLVITPGGYDPLRFSVKKGQPVHLTFKQLGPVGCGNELLIPAGTGNPIALRLADEQDVQSTTFTPTQSGEITFYCPHQMYRGIMIVRE